MLAVGISVAATVLLVAAWRWARLQRFKSLLAIASDIPLLEQDLAALMARARDELPTEQLAALTDELRQIRGIEQRLSDGGTNPWEAKRLGLEGALRSVANHLALNVRLPG